MNNLLQSNYARLQSEKQQLKNGSLDMLIKYLTKEHIPTCYSELHDALIKIADNYPLIPKILDRIFFDVTEIPDNEEWITAQYVALLHDYVNQCFVGNQKTKNINILIDLEDNYKSLILCTLKKENIVDALSNINVVNLYTPLLNDIMDLYIPSLSPENTINFISTLFATNVTELMSHLYDIIWLHSCNGGLDNDIKDTELLFLYISDLYTHRDNYASFLSDLCMLLCSKYRIKRIYHDINERHLFQLKKIGININDADIYDFLSEFVYILNKGNVDSRLIQYFYNNFYSEKMKDEYKEVVSIFCALLNETNYALKLTGMIDKNKYSENDKMINHEVYRTLRWMNKNEINDEESIVSESYLIDNKHGIEFACEAFKKDSVAMKKSTDKIYRAYKSYKNAEDKVDAQVTKAVKGLGKVAIGDVRTEIIEGKKFSAISLLKKLLGTVAIFSIGPIKGAVALVVRYALKKNVSISERKKIIMELETELELIDEKINDAQGDNNRQAKYAMMRTRSELKHALERIEYGLEADSKSIAKASSVLAKSKAENQ